MSPELLLRWAEIVQSACEDPESHWEALGAYADTTEYYRQLGVKL